MKIILAWGDFHVRSRFARSTIPEGKWRLLVVADFGKFRDTAPLNLSPSLLERLSLFPVS